MEKGGGEGKEKRYAAPREKSREERKKKGKKKKKRKKKESTLACLARMKAAYKQKRGGKKRKRKKGDGPDRTGLAWRVVGAPPKKKKKKEKNRMPASLRGKKSDFSSEGRGKREKKKKIKREPTPPVFISPPIRTGRGKEGKKTNGAPCLARNGGREGEKGKKRREKIPVEKNFRLTGPARGEKEEKKKKKKKKSPSAKILFRTTLVPSFGHTREDKGGGTEKRRKKEWPAEITDSLVADIQSTRGGRKGRGGGKRKRPLSSCALLPWRR